MNVDDGFTPVRTKKERRSAKKAVTSVPYEANNEMPSKEETDAVMQPVDPVPVAVEEVSFKPIEESAVTAQHISAQEQQRSELRKLLTKKVITPEHRIGALKKSWVELTKPVIEELKLAVKFVPRVKQIWIVPAWVLSEPSSAEEKPSDAEVRKLESHVTKAVEYFKAFLVGFQVRDALAVLRLEDIFLQSFKITEVRRLEGENLSRAIGRVAGKNGRTRDAIQNATRTRILIQDKNVHLLGGFENITLARDAIGSLIIGAPPNKVHSHLGVVSRRMKERA
ncbi:putative RNA-binding protein PNO1 [Gregarina niphandrodes]|uniref:RNA-binding protein PNO1 n=1 Tax=Gregarina niphandrodes TaxID=110365 RepID=A0A023B8I9_GRENI|nr:putative RNA-binding protein PNO1 [Gregarina niphandrodes]EZG69113.1 putative RNA-binding protein PNO1 [Gregarina niphandrodes]|eukprot:XP_011134493.1 putative RNA-binding protein PNO1 [Gregarina niphandrodes]